MANRDPWVDEMMGFGAKLRRLPMNVSQVARYAQLASTRAQNVFVEVDAGLPADLWEPRAEGVACVSRQLSQSLTLLNGGADPGQLGVLLATDNTIRALNAEYRGVDAPTDILSFGTDGYLACSDMGDLVVGVAQVIHSARKIMLNGDDIAEDVLWESRIPILLVHGLAHLIGHTHNTDSDHRTMQAVEKSLMRHALLGGTATSTANANMCECVRAGRGIDQGWLCRQCTDVLFTKQG